MKKRTIAALALLIAFTSTSCGNIGRPDPGTITRKNEEERKIRSDDSVVTTDEEEPTTSEDTSQIEVIPEVYSPEDDPEAFIKATIENMTLEEKVGQLFFVRPDALETEYDDTVINDDDIGGVTYVDDMMKKAMEKYHVGGITLHEKNIIDEEQLKKLTAELQENAELPIFIGVDEIGGEFAPIANNANFNVRQFRDMNNAQTPENAKIVGTEIGKYLVKYGINLDFAPIADVSLYPEDVTPSNFSADATVVASLVDAEIDGLHESGVMSAVKHFPGYADGNAEGNDIFLDVSDWDSLLSSDVLPYINVLDKTDMLLVGHISLPSVISDDMPTSMSKDFIEGKIRDELGYKGVIITDSMSANSILYNYPRTESAVYAIEAGADIILMPYDLDESYEAVLKAVKDDKISEDRLNESVERILMLKVNNGMFGTTE